MVPSHYYQSNHIQELIFLFIINHSDSVVNHLMQLNSVYWNNWGIISTQKSIHKWWVTLPSVQKHPDIKNIWLYKAIHISNPKNGGGVKSKWYWRGFLWQWIQMKTPQQKQQGHSCKSLMLDKFTLQYSRNIMSLYTILYCSFNKYGNCDFRWSNYFTNH